MDPQFDRGEAQETVGDVEAVVPMDDVERALHLLVGSPAAQAEFVAWVVTGVDHPMPPSHIDDDFQAAIQRSVVPFLLSDLSFVSRVPLWLWKTLLLARRPDGAWWLQGVSAMGPAPRHLWLLRAVVQAGRPDRADVLELLLAATNDDGTPRAYGEYGKSRVAQRRDTPGKKVWLWVPGTLVFSTVQYALADAIWLDDAASTMAILRAPTFREEAMDKPPFLIRAAVHVGAVRVIQGVLGPDQAPDPASPDLRAQYKDQVNALGKNVQRSLMTRGRVPIALWLLEQGLMDRTTVATTLWTALMVASNKPDNEDLEYNESYEVDRSALGFASREEVLSFAKRALLWLRPTLLWNDPIVREMLEIAGWSKYISPPLSTVNLTRWFVQHAFPVPPTPEGRSEVVTWAATLRTPTVLSVLLAMDVYDSALSPEDAFEDAWLYDRIGSVGVLLQDPRVVEYLVHKGQLLPDQPVNWGPFTRDLSVIAVWEAEGAFPTRDDARMQSILARGDAEAPAFGTWEFYELVVHHPGTAVMSVLMSVPAFRSEVEDRAVASRLLTYASTEDRYDLVKVLLADRGVRGAVSGTLAAALEHGVEAWEARARGAALAAEIGAAAEAEAEAQAGEEMEVQMEAASLSLRDPDPMDVAFHPIGEEEGGGEERMMHLPRFSPM